MVPVPNKETDSKIELTSRRGGDRSAGIGAAGLLAARQPRGRGPRSGPATAATQTPTAAPSPRREDGHAGPEESRRATLSRGRRGRRSSEHSPGRNAVQSRATRSCAWARGGACPTHVVVRGLPRPPRVRRAARERGPAGSSRGRGAARRRARRRGSPHPALLAGFLKRSAARSVAAPRARGLARRFTAAADHGAAQGVREPFTNRRAP